MDNRVKEYRIKLKLTQEELANRSGLSRYLISQIENGDDVNLTKNTMVAIANVLNVKVSRLFML